MKNVKGWWIVAGVVIGHVLVNIIWLYIDKTPPAWDQAAHLRSAVLAHQWLTGIFWGNFIDLVRAMGGYPPLIYLLGAVWSLVFGVGVAQLTLINSIFLAAAMAGVYRLAKEAIGSEETIHKRSMTAAGAAVLFSFLPVIFDISRNMLLDLPLTAFVTWGICFFIKSDFLSKRKWAAGFLVTLVLASLTKLNGFIYFGPMVILAVIESVKRREMKIFLNLVTMALIYGAAVGWWWLVNFQNIYQYLTGLAGQGEPLTDPMNLLDWHTWIHYFKLFLLHQMSPLPTLVFLAAVYFWSKNIKRHQNKIILAIFVVFNYLVFTYIHNKDFRFTMPLLPAAAIIFAWGLSEIRKRNLRIFQWTTGFLVFYFLAYFIENSFGWPISKDLIWSIKTFAFGDVNIVNISDYPVRSAKNTIWPQESIIKDLAMLNVDTNKELQLLVLINREEVNDNNLSLYKELIPLAKFNTGSVGDRVQFNSDEELSAYLSKYDYYLIPDRTYDAAPFYGINVKAYGQARDYILDHPERFKVLQTYTVYGDKNLWLMGKN